MGKLVQSLSGSICMISMALLGLLLSLQTISVMNMDNIEWDYDPYQEWEDNSYQEWEEEEWSPKSTEEWKKAPEWK